MEHPECLKQLRDEIKGFEREGKISNPVKFQEAQKMPYLQAVIKETLRLHPATGQPMARTVPPGGAELAGTFFPSGVSLGTCSLDSNILSDTAFRQLSA